MTDREIERGFELKVLEERRVTVEAIELLVKIDQRDIHLARGYSSLFKFLTEKFEYSEGAANRRIAAAKILREFPEVGAKLRDGRLNLTILALAHTFIKKAPREKKREALKAIERISKVKAEQVLYSLFPEMAERKKETIKVNSEKTFILSTEIPDEVMERFQQVRDSLSNTLPNASFVEVADYFFKKHLARNAAAAKQRVNSENVTITPKTKIILRKPCTYQDPLTGKVCGSTYMIHVDHIQMRVHGGGNEEENLRPLCAPHNQFMARQSLGLH